MARGQEDSLIESFAEVITPAAAAVDEHMTTATSEHAADASANELKPTSAERAAAGNVAAAATASSSEPTDAAATADAATERSTEDAGWCALDISFIASGETMLVRALHLHCT